ncbi:MAG: hypothetical protein H6566_18450 [Lewinellaceae bacterium]|nr:hypothetical protein [Lewinellaceae bacterium]
MTILDTQIVSYKFRESKGFDIKGCVIPSIVAIEFLLLQAPQPHKANYYIPRNRKFFQIEGGIANIVHPFNKRSTDRVIFDFGPFYPPFSMFSNFGISDLINEKDYLLFNFAIKFLDKPIQKKLRNRIKFLFDNNLSCEPLLETDIEKSYELLDLFLSRYNAKDDFRNTWNDILILCKALNNEAIVYTEDKLLARFASEIFQGSINSHGDGLIIDFSISNRQEAESNRESKWYVNRGWQYRMKKARYAM